MARMQDWKHRSVRASSRRRSRRRHVCSAGSFTLHEKDSFKQMLGLCTGFDEI